MLHYIWLGFLFHNQFIPSSFAFKPWNLDYWFVPSSPNLLTAYLMTKNGWLRLSGFEMGSTQLRQDWLMSVYAICIVCFLMHTNVLMHWDFGKPMFSWIFHFSPFIFSVFFLAHCRGNNMRWRGRREFSSKSHYFHLPYPMSIDWHVNFTHAFTNRFKKKDLNLTYLRSWFTTCWYQRS